MDRESKRRLAPFAKVAAALDWRATQYAQGLSDAELAVAIADCESVSTTNCGWDTYAAAQYLIRHLKSERLMRARKTA